MSCMQSLKMRMGSFGVRFIQLAKKVLKGCASILKGYSLLSDIKNLTLIKPVGHVTRLAVSLRRKASPEQ